MGEFETAMNSQTGSGTSARRISSKASQFSESVIREMSRQAMLHNAINLAQGFPDFPAPEELKRAAQQAIADDINQYAITWGARDLRQAIAAKAAEWQGLKVDPETDVTVCCGATEAMIAALLATVNAGDEVIVFEPFYENYGADAILSDASAALCSAASAGDGGRRLVVRPGGVAGGLQPEHARHHSEYAE